ncbi:hypothetical protein K432DRAFT_456422 [Lepidopterella palustris CBS 459.81]|uniref:Uncharacterized protein n=1 Tax=Lepidopterella palustris CBS 459.81 TaxID=1314670 RepID=A0A8E2E7Y6_9PEZI|nr:hypothetical protein K432DRAFT_456422 [Lepidopterella palustris CBS 459.81]
MHPRNCSGLILGTIAATHGTLDGHSDDKGKIAKLQEIYGNTSIPFFFPRSHEEVSRIFQGLHLVEPGVVFLDDWRIELDLPAPAAVKWLYGGMARKNSSPPASAVPQRCADLIQFRKSLVSSHVFTPTSLLVLVWCFVAMLAQSFMDVGITSFSATEGHDIRLRWKASMESNKKILSGPAPSVPFFSTIFLCQSHVITDCAAIQAINANLSCDVKHHRPRCGWKSSTSIAIRVFPKIQGKAILFLCNDWHVDKNKIPSMSDMLTYMNSSVCQREVVSAELESHDINENWTAAGFPVPERRERDRSKPLQRHEKAARSQSGSVGIDSNKDDFDMDDDDISIFKRIVRPSERTDEEFEKGANGQKSSKSWER